LLKLLEALFFFILGCYLSW